MRVIDFQQSLSLGQNTVLSLGGFDGIHLGHQKLIERLKAKALEKKALSCLLLLDPLPFQVLKGLAFKRLFTIKETRKLLEPFGLDALCLVPFNKALAGLSPQEFINDFLKRCFAPLALLVGYDFRFGKGRAGDFALLKQLAPFEIERFQAVQQKGSPVSSSRIRELLAQADMEGVRRLLGRPFSLEAQVIKGEGRGRALGFPTANLKPDEAKSLPPAGVYAGRLVLDRLAGAPAQGLKNPLAVGATKPVLLSTKPLAEKQSQVIASGGEASFGSTKNFVAKQSQDRQGRGPSLAREGSTKPPAAKQSQGLKQNALPAVVNIGYRPTFARSKEKSLLIEAHALFHQEDFYGQWVKLELDFFIRKEKVFPAPLDLQTAVRQDIKKAQALLGAGH